ncbi:hypothetical protein Tco_1338482 [Tanacetum coccineum]
MEFFCQQCICKFCGKGAHYGYNCPPKVPIISNPEQCNQTINELPQILPNVHPTCNYEDENSFIYDSKPHSFNVSPSVFNQPPQPQFETYLCELCGNNAHYGYDCSPQFPFVYEQEPYLIKAGSEVQKKEQAYEEEKYSAACRYMFSITCDDEDDYIPSGDIIARYSTSKSITPDLPIQEPNNSLNMGDEHPQTTIPQRNRPSNISDFVESLINRDTSIVYSSKIDPILEEFADELAHIAPIPLGIVEANPDDDTSSDDDHFEDVEYVSLEEVNEEKEFDLEDILQIQDVILREKLLNVHRLISNIESLKVNSTPDRVLESPSPFPIPVADSDSFLEESDTSFSHLDNSLPEFETFSDHTEETRSGSTLLNQITPFPEYDSFLFEIEPDQEGLISIDNSNNTLLELPEFESFHFDPSFPRPPPEPPDVEILEPENNNFDVLNNDESFDPREGENVVFLNVEEDDSFTFTIRTFLPFVTYPEASPLSCSTGSEDTIFDPGIST